jgi:CRISPR/Cas system-associated endoribonuclease Cas2
LEEDSVRIYRICSSCMTRAVIQGQGFVFSQFDWEVL